MGSTKRDLISRNKVSAHLIMKAFGKTDPVAQGYK